MKLRHLSIALLSAAVAVPLAAVPASADTGPGIRGGSLFKNSATKRFVPAPVVAPRAVAPAPKPPAPAPKPAVSEIDAFQARVLQLTNNERTQRGLGALKVSGCADGFADRWAVRLASDGSLSHQSLTNVMNSCGARGAGENVAYGNVSADEMVRMWMNSEGHRKNLLNPAYTHLGVGAVKTSSGRVYGVQDFLTA